MGETVHAMPAMGLDTHRRVVELGSGQPIRRRLPLADYQVPLVRLNSDCSSAVYSFVEWPAAA